MSEHGIGEGLRVLVTGAAGGVGRPVSRALVERGHVVTGFDRAARPDDWAGGAWHQGELTDAAAVRRAVEGVEVVVHLAAQASGGADFMEQLLEPNVIGVYHVMDASREAGVKRVVLTSSVQVVGALREKASQWRRPLRESDGAAPTNHYALTKLWAEQMGEMYARVHGMSVISVRLGWLPRDGANMQRVGNRPDRRERYLSWDDAGRFFTCAVEAKGVDHAVLFAFSLGDEACPYHFDREAARAVIGYEPRDRYPEGVPFAVRIEECEAE